MKLSSRKFSLEQFKSPPEWMSTFLSTLNAFISEVYFGFQNNLTIEDNLYQEIIELKFINESSNLPIKFKPKWNKNPKYIDIVYCTATDNSNSSEKPWPTWSFSDNQISITALTGLTASKIYNIKIHVVYA